MIVLKDFHWGFKDLGVISEYWEQYNFVGTFNIFQGVGVPVPQHRHGRQRGADHARGGPLPQVHHGRHLGGQHREDLRRAGRLRRQGRGLPRIQSRRFIQNFITLSVIQRPSIVECKLYIPSKRSEAVQNTIAKIFIENMNVIFADSYVQFSWQRLESL